MAWRPGTGEVLLTVEDRHHRQSLHLWNPATGRARLIVASEGFLSGGHDGQLPCAVTRAVALCVAASAISPPRLERIDLETGAETILYDPNAALRAVRMPRVERLAWTTPEGDRFTGILLLPAGVGTGRLPLFINYYLCGGFLSGGVGEELPLLPLAASGMAVACINLPPANGVEDFLGRYPQGLRAVRTLVEALGRRGVIDPAKVGMAGLSFGSEVTMWTLFNSNLLAAAAIASSQIEPTYYWFNSVRGRSQPDVLRRFWELGAPDETPEAWRRRTAAANVASIRAPLLMQLPEQEARNVIELYARLSRSPTPTELYVFPDAAHIKVQPRQRLAAHERYLDWFRFWLQGFVDPDPAKADQYRRWIELRARRPAGSTPPGAQP
jgi:dipeptidyl aminopeptidase/acylaminoacyl peptidase